MNRFWVAGAAIVVALVMVMVGVAPTDRPTVTSSSPVAQPYRLVSGQDPDGLDAIGAPTGWAPDPDLPLDQAIPRPWPDGYKQPFTPWLWMTNLVALCAWDQQHGPDPDAAELAGRLFDRLHQYTEVVDDARFVVYRFGHTYEGEAVEAPWTSALGNGVVIAGIVAAHDCWPDHDRLDLAFELAVGYTVEGPVDGLWFARRTDDGFLWLEEVPATRSQILNGHIHATTGLYYLWDRHARHDRQMEQLIIDAADATLAYLPQFRRPGRVNCYDLTPPCHDDYGPERTVKQMRALHVITGRREFASWAELFAADISRPTRSH